MKNSTKQTIISIILGIVVYFIEFVVIFGIVKLIVKIVDVIRARRYDKTHKNDENDAKIPETVENVENVELDTKPWVKTTPTTWDNLRPLVEDSYARCDDSIYGEFQETTMREVVDGITRYYSSTRALVDIHYKGKSLDVWIMPSSCTVHVEGDGDREFVVDDEFLNMTVKCTHRNMHVVVIEDDKLDHKPLVETPKTAWDNLKPYTFKSDDRFNVSVFKVWEDSTMKEVINNILHYYICKKALVSVVYKGKALDVWVVPGTKTMYLDRDNTVKFEVDDDFLNMKVKMTKENIHLALIED